MSESRIFVSFRLGSPKKTLLLSRAPLFLRFVVQGTGWRTIDALDQPDDTPAENEHVIGAMREGPIGLVHYDGCRNGKRFSGWEQCATYMPIVDVEKNVLRDNEKWRAWCMSRVSAAEPSAAPAPPSSTPTTPPRPTT